ncbi:MAG: dipicolinate synthase [Oscillibacter sp.]|nr:dipicolinate synthase [Oscillibacter sp.]
MKKTFGVAGGGQRAAELVQLLRRDGHQVSAYGVPGSAETLEEALGAEVVILPVPLRDADGTLNCPGVSLSVTETLSRFREGQSVFAGQIPEDVASQARRMGVSLTDYMKQEPMAVENAAATADAALCLSVTETRETLTGKPCLVLGFGRIGKLLCHRLHGIGAQVTAAARSPDARAWIRALGFPALDTARLTGSLKPFRMVYNTIPAPVLDSELLRELPAGAFLMDLASKPGMDTDAADRLGLSYVRARGLPGKVVPRRAAEILRDTVCHLLRE